jgi:uncharacterized membrane protein
MNPVEAFLSAEEELAVIQAIRDAENQTSGEIRVHLEKGTQKHVMDRAKEVFYFLNMDQTRQHNAVLIYVAVEKKEFAILGDSEISRKVPDNFWELERDIIQKHFSSGNNKLALIEAIRRIGDKLKLFFPLEEDDINELPDSISKIK